MKNKVLLLSFSCLAIAILTDGSPAKAQNATVVATCGTQSDPAGSTRGAYQNTAGQRCVTGTGGGSGGAVYGPTAVGSAAANPPVLQGGTADATATGTVQVRKVDSSGNAYISASDGQIVNLGTSTDAASCASGTSSLACLRQLHTDVTSAIPAGTAVIGYTTADPCGQATKLGAPINLTASGQVITGTAAKKTYICSIDLVSATAQNIALVEGTGSTCATNIFGLAGGTTAATGWNLSANGGLTKGSGVGTVYSPSADSNGTSANVCLLLSSTGQTSGQITYVQQ